MLEALWTTTLTVLYGFLIAAVIGFSLGVLVGETKFGERAVMPYLVAIDTMPKIAFAPLFINADQHHGHMGAISYIQGAIRLDNGCESNDIANGVVGVVRPLHQVGCQGPAETAPQQRR